MAGLFGSDYTREELLRRVGNFAQVAGIREYTYNSGRAGGTKAVEVNTGPFRFELLADKCLDIAFASYKGVPFSYISKSGVRNPAYYNKVDDFGFQDNFLAGALTTCGLHNVGPAGECQGRKYQLHGNIAAIPAEKVSVSEAWDGDDCTYAVSGEMRHSTFYREDLVLRRKITSRMGAASLVVEDEVENMDFAPSPCFLFYHAQFGFPFLDADTKLITSPIVKTEGRTPDAEKDKANFAKFAAPKDGALEQCFLHTFTPNAEGLATACLFNPRLGERGMGVYVRFNPENLPVFVQWKMLRSREYVCGLEPGAVPLDDRSAATVEKATLRPLEKRSYRIEIGVIEGEEECRDFAGAK
jgi:hypothetical protein